MGQHCGMPCIQTAGGPSGKVQPMNMGPIYNQGQAMYGPGSGAPPGATNLIMGGGQGYNLEQNYNSI